MSHWKRPPPRRQPFTPDYFWTFVTKTSGCWIFADGRSRGTINVGDYRRERAYRVAWRLTYGPIPKGIGVCHHCDNPACVRPDHLFLGTQAENLADASRKGRLHRYTVGESNPNATLTAAQVKRIRQLYKPGVYGLVAQLARRFKVSHTHIDRIVSGESWRKER